MYQLNFISKNEYNDLYKNINSDLFCNYHITQCPDYENSMLYISIKKSSVYVGICCIQKRKLLYLFNIYRINRGPLIFKNISDKEYNLLLNELLDFLKTNKIYFLTIVPNLKFQKQFFKFDYLNFKLPFPVWGTISIKLNDINLIYKNLRPNWRRSLKKSLRNLKVNEVCDELEFNKIIDEYSNSAIRKNFKPLAIEKLKKWRFLLTNKINSFPLLRVYKTFLPEDPRNITGAVGVASYKNTSLYLFGYSTDVGRKYHSNTLLLWHALNQSFLRGEIEFDLGGFSDDTPYGIRIFKEGLNGKKYSLANEYLCLLFFKRKIKIRNLKH